MNFYIYDSSTGEHIDTITGTTNEECERLADEKYNWDDYLASYTYAPKIEVDQ